jgi:hypothetical protein
MSRRPAHVTRALAPAALRLGFQRRGLVHHPRDGLQRPRISPKERLHLGSAWNLPKRATFDRRLKRTRLHRASSAWGARLTHTNARLQGGLIVRDSPREARLFYFYKYFHVFILCTAASYPCRIRALLIRLLARKCLAGTAALCPARQLQCAPRTAPCKPSFHAVPPTLGHLVLFGHGLVSTSSADYALMVDAT